MKPSFSIFSEAGYQLTSCFSKSPRLSRRHIPSWYMCYVLVRDIYRSLSCVHGWMDGCGRPTGWRALAHPTHARTGPMVATSCRDIVRAVWRHLDEHRSSVRCVDNSITIARVPYVRACRSTTAHPVVDRRRETALFVVPWFSSGWKENGDGAVLLCSCACAPTSNAMSKPKY
jgi:hypothetical protein